MAKKKNQSKKHTFKHAEPAISASQTSQPADIARPGVAPRSAVAGVSVRDFSYVTADLRRIVVIGGALVVGEIVLWYLFGHTSLGTHVYNVIHL